MVLGTSVAPFREENSVSRYRVAANVTDTATEG